MLKTCFLPLWRGAGQMLFQPSALTGGVFLLLILFQSVPALVMCLAGLGGATAVAYWLEHPGRAYFDGEGGFNGGLLGLVLALFYEVSPALLLLAVAGGGVAGLVRAGLLRVLPVPPFTAPFVLVSWPAFGAAEGLAIATRALPAIDPWPLYAIMTNASQVLFMLHPWVGVLVVLAVALHSRAAALWVVVASVIAWLTAVLAGLPADLTAAGLLGYNAMILAAALQHRSTGRLLFTTGVLVSVGLSYLFWRSGVTPLSAPFVLSAWLVIGVEALLARRSAVRHRG